jgi:hypothetical protein
MTIELALQLVIVPGIPASFDYEHEQTEADLQKKSVQSWRVPGGISALGDRTGSKNTRRKQVTSNET